MGEITLSERAKRPSLIEIFRMIDAAGDAKGAYDQFLDRDTSLPEEREWP